MPLFKWRSASTATTTTARIYRAALERQWTDAAASAEEWAQQAQWLAEQTPHVTMAAHGARESQHAAEYARAAANTSGRKAANLRAEAAESARMAAMYAVGVSGNLAFSGAILQAMANTWHRAEDIATLLTSLEEQMRT
jgi:hypothetical protein